MTTDATKDVSGSSAGDETALTCGVWALCANSAVRRAARQLGQLYDDAIGPSGLRGTQFSLLAQISRTGSPALQPLAAALVMDLSALGHTLKPLLRDGLVTLAPDPKDRRVRRVSLTETGVARLSEAEAMWRKAQRRFETLVGEEDAAALMRILGKVSSAGFRDAFEHAESVPTGRKNEHSEDLPS
ncbi:MarR family winged helix-turn-helix transcriptional regulator [Methylobrevis pamukkalensis]|uniref:Transcriptional regulator SlyA n=1 Tax=Methylobrevis pamukkalensis TaxID=1439726 RepID=A0A1E3H6Q8_9HYPH|nr:MarR family winged helix-turn-helix transcriptional regulator [Methylobrevis pamukkalensis]ODN72018.1 transcriptional regulator SlyA [Methylobrevis pamukkalensis]